MFLLLSIFNIDKIHNCFVFGCGILGRVEVGRGNKKSVNPVWVDALFICCDLWLLLYPSATFATRSPVQTTFVDVS